MDGPPYHQNAISDHHPLLDGLVTTLRTSDRVHIHPHHTRQGHRRPTMDETENVVEMFHRHGGASRARRGIASVSEMQDYLEKRGKSHLRRSLSHFRPLFHGLLVLYLPQQASKVYSKPN